MANYKTRLKLIIHDLLLDCKGNARLFRRRFGLDELFEDVLSDADTPSVIAGKSLFHLCTEDGKFNGSTIGLKSVLRFLAETSEEAPVTDDDVHEFLLRLKRALDSHPSVDSITKVINEWYSFRSHPKSRR